MADAEADEAAWREGGQAAAMEILRSRHPSDIVGASLRIYSRRDGQWHAITVDAFHAQSKRHRVIFADGKRVNLNLHTERWLEAGPLPPMNFPSPLVHSAADATDGTQASAPAAVAPAAATASDNALRPTARRTQPARAAGEAASWAARQLAASEAKGGGGGGSGRRNRVDDDDDAESDNGSDGGPNGEETDGGSSEDEVVPPKGRRPARSQGNKRPTTKAAPKQPAKRARKRGPEGAGRTRTGPSTAPADENGLPSAGAALPTTGATLGADGAVIDASGGCA